MKTGLVMSADIEFVPVHLWEHEETN